MNRRVLVVEPDATMRRMIEIALENAGYAPSSVATIEASRAVLDGTKIDGAIVELRATHAEGAEGVRALRADHPDLPLVVTSTLLTTRLMQALIQARVDDVVAKPFTPRELVGAINRAIERTRLRRDGALEYAAAMAVARRAIIDGRASEADGPLSRARASSPLDAEAMAMLGLCRELEGHDADAERAYRAALALVDETITDDASPREGLARLRAYAGARAVRSFSHDEKKILWFVGDVTTELEKGPPRDAKPDVIVTALGLTPNAAGAIYARRSADDRCFLIATGALTERLARRVARTFAGAIVVAHDETLARVGSLTDVGGDAPRDVDDERHDESDQSHTEARSRGTDGDEP